MRWMRCALVLAVVAIFGSTKAANVLVDIDPYVNTDLTTYTGGSGYPQSGGEVIVSGVAQRLGRTSAGKTGAAVFGNTTLAIPVEIHGAVQATTLSNSAYGTAGATNGRVEFVGAAGAFASFDIVQGVLIRDHYQGSYNNVASGLSGTLGYATRVRLDQQRFILPPEFAIDTLIAVRFVGTNNGRPQGVPFLESLTLIPARRPGDVDGDGTVVLDDFLLLAASYEIPSGQPGFNVMCDLDLDGVVDIADFLILAANYEG